VRWQGRGEPDLLSFTAITDEPPQEIAAAGHDRCIIPIKPENIDAWLDPDPADLAAQYASLGASGSRRYAQRGRGGNRASSSAGTFWFDEDFQID